jgi:hypothetical protein
MGPDFVIQHVIAAQGGAWFDIEEETEVPPRASDALPLLLYAHQHVRTY